MARIVSVLSARPPGSRADAVGRRAGHRLVAAGHNVVEVHLRELPAESLLWREVDHPSLVAVVEAVTRADGLIVTSPVHQASIAAPVKAFLDLFPMSGLRGTTVLPFMVGGSAGHVLALDYGLRPVLQGLAPAHLAAGRYVVASAITLTPDWPQEAFRREATIEASVAAQIDRATDEFAGLLRPSPADEEVSAGIGRASFSRVRRPVPHPPVRRSG